MSLEDFEGLDTDEFDVMLSVWHECEDNKRREAWERARIIGTLSVSPWVKGRLRPERVLPLPWDKSRASNASNMKTRKPVSKEEDLRRLKILMGK